MTKPKMSMTQAYDWYESLWVWWRTIRKASDKGEVYSIWICEFYNGSLMNYRNWRSQKVYAGRLHTLAARDY